MPLDPLQEKIARTALALPEVRTLALAGGGAMITHGFVDRATKDVDLFTEIDDQEAVRVVVDPATGAECTVEIFADGGRLRGLVTLDVGPVLHPDDLAADKVLALWDRARPRDYFDVDALLERYGPDRLLELAATKDAGFTPATFVDALRAIARLSPADWAEDGVPAKEVERLCSRFDAWRDQLMQSGGVGTTRYGSSRD